LSAKAEENMTDRDTALAILAGYPYGATEAALAKHGITRATLDALVAQGLITFNRDRFAVAARAQHDPDTLL
jgi:hypothetical protein